MNTWIRRAVGTVGVAGGMLLLGAGTAHAQGLAPTTGALDDLTSPAGDLAALDAPDNLGVTLDTPGARWSAGALDDGPVAFGPNHGEVGATLHTPGEHGQARDVFAGGRLPAQDLLPLGGLPRTEALPLMSGHLPALTGQGLPSLDAASVRGVLHPVDDLTVPVGRPDTEAYVPLVGDVMQDNTMNGLPSLPDLLSDYLPKHAAGDEAEALPALGGLSGLPLIGNLLAGGTGLLGQ